MQPADYIWRCKNRSDEPKVEIGLKVKGTNILISDILHFLEDDMIYEYLKKHFKNLTQEQIESALRMATIVLVAFEKPLLKM
jgi:hypothetical protein